jgi:transcription elongation factor Elf1
MVCPDCKTGYMLSHPEDEQAAKKWLKCTICGFCCKEPTISIPNSAKTDEYYDEYYDESFQKYMDELQLSTERDVL